MEFGICILCWVCQWSSLTIRNKISIVSLIKQIFIHKYPTTRDELCTNVAPGGSCVDGEGVEGRKREGGVGAEGLRAR